MKKKTVPIKKLVNLAATGKLNIAFKVLKKASAGSKSAPAIWLQLSGIYGAQGNLQLTKKCCEKALEIEPNYALAYSHLGNVYSAVGDSEKAINFSQRAVNLQPDDPSILFNFSVINRNLGHYPKAIQCLKKAIQYRPDHPESHYIIGSCYQASGVLEKLVEHYKKAIHLKPDFIECMVNLGYHYINIGDIQLANEYFDRALVLQPNHNSTLSGKADALLRVNDKPGSYAIIRSLIDRNDITANALYAYSLLGEDYGDSGEIIDLAEGQLRKPGLPNADRAVLGFALGRTYDRLAQYDKAFINYKLGNDASQNTFDSSDFAEYILKIHEQYNLDFTNSFEKSDVEFEDPVFIIGMPRSGTSLIEQILSKHSNVYAAGELNYIFDMTKHIHKMTGSTTLFPASVSQLSTGQLNDLAHIHIKRIRKLCDIPVARITDKMPSNYTYLGLISQIFPRAKIIHCERDPRDTCLSIYFQNFQNFQQYAGDLEKIGNVYLQYKKLMEHWNEVLNIPILNVQYESVVENTEKNAREIIEFCGLEWEDGCLEFHKSQRRVITASFDQVNKPIYTKSVARWKNYEKHLGGLQKILQPILDE